jgi:hypothetical protein
VQIDANAHAAEALLGLPEVHEDGVHMMMVEDPR